VYFQIHWKSLKLYLFIYKNGDRSNPENYSSISPLTTFEKKILEKLMWCWLIEFLKKKKILYDKYQFGFRKHHSTVLALMSLTDNIYHRLDKHEFVTGIYFNLQKVFDMVNHENLLYKLHNYGIRGVSSVVRKTFIKRQQFTSLGLNKSDIGYVTTGFCFGPTTIPAIHMEYCFQYQNQTFCRRH